jgi:hypothetical protein
MATSEDIAASVLALSDAELAQEPFDPADREMQLLDEDFFGVAIVAPPSIDPSTRDELPVVAGFRTTGARAFEVGRDRNTVLFAMDLDTRAVRFGMMFFNPKQVEYPPDETFAPGRPTGPSATSVGALVRRVDARARLDLPWSPSRLRLGVLQFDERSNVVDVVLAGDRPFARAHEVSPRPSPPVMGETPSPSIPTFLPFGTPPPIAPSRRASLVFGVVDDPVRGVDLLLYGSFTVRAEPAHVPQSFFGVVEIDGAEHPVAAVIPITFALAALDGGVAAHLELGVPVYDVALAQPGQDLAGYFTLDVRALVPGSLAKGAYRVYAFAEGELFGPHPLDVA